MANKTASSKALIRGPLHDIKAIKKLIYDTLRNDSVLTTLLGGSDNIYHYFPATKDISHPAIFYSIISEETFPYNENDGNSSLTGIVFGIDIIDDSSTSSRSDNIENRIFYLLNGKILKDSDVIFKHPCKRTYYFQFFDTEIRVWRTVMRFQSVTAPI